MAMQIRRGLLKDFDPYKMKQGELACSVDTSTGNQYVWCCFNPGVVKRLGTYEDFTILVQEAIEDATDELKEELRTYLEQLKTDTETYIQLKIDKEWIPQLQSYVTQAQQQATNAQQSATQAAASEANAKTSETNAKTSENNAKTSATQASTSASNASTSEQNALKSAQDSANSASDSEDFSKLSESWAHGNTKVRDGEDTDNSKYWSERSKSIHDQAQSDYEQFVQDMEDTGQKWDEQLKEDSQKYIDQAKEDGEAYVEQAKSYADEVKDKAEFKWMGTYDEGTTYTKNNLVFYNGSVYIALADDVTGVPSDNHETWELFAYGQSLDAGNIMEWNVTLDSEKFNDGTYEIEDERIKESDILEFFEIVNSDAEEKAYARLKLRKIEYENNRAVLTYSGEEPSIDLYGKLRVTKG